MTNYSQAHICQCLTRLSTLSSTTVVTITGNYQKTGHQFAEDVLSLAPGLLQLGLGNGDIVAICGFNRVFCKLVLENVGLKVIGIWSGYLQLHMLEA